MKTLLLGLLVITGCGHDDDTSQVTEAYLESADVSACTNEGDQMHLEGVLHICSANVWTKL